MTELSQQVVSNPKAPEGIYAPTLYIHRPAWDMLQTYVDKVGNTEINGFGYITIIDRDFYWTTSDDVFITRQAVTLGSAKNTGSSFAKAVYRSVVEKRQKDLRLQWHSHVWGEAYPSPTDMATIDSRADQGMQWFVSLVANKRAEVTARYDMYRPFRSGAPMRVVILSDIDATLAERALADIAELVTVEEPKKLVVPGKLIGPIPGKGIRRRRRNR